MTEAINIKEVRIKSVDSLSESAKREVTAKLEALPDGFNYRGYAKVSYAENSPLKVVDIAPIEGTGVDFFDELIDRVIQE